MKPVLSRLWTAFPDHVRYPTLLDLYTMFGGVAERNINVPGFGPNGNTCASRLSHAFNKGGAPIGHTIARAIGAETIGTADGNRVIFKVTHFKLYLLRVLGRPLIDDASPFDDGFRGKNGIIALTFRVGATRPATSR